MPMSDIGNIQSLYQWFLSSFENFRDMSVKHKNVKISQFGHKICKYLLARYIKKKTDFTQSNSV